MRLGKFLASFFLLSFTGIVWASPAYVQSATTQTTSATISVAFGSSNTAGNTLVVFLFEYGSASSSQILNSFSDSQGNVYNRVVWTTNWTNANSGRFGNLYVYMVSNCKSGANTVTAVFNVGVTEGLDIYEYSGLSSYSLEGVSWSGPNTSTATTNSGSVYASSGDLLVGWADNSNSNSTVFTTPSGYTLRRTFSGAGIGTVEYDNTASSSGLVSVNGVIGGSSGGMFSGILSFRQTNPSVGRMQLVGFTTASSIAYPQPNVAGDLLIAMCRYTGTFGTASDTQSNSWVTLPVTAESDGNSFMSFLYAANIASGANTVTCSGSPTGMALWEYTGVNSASPLAGSSVFFSNAPSVSSWSTGTVNLPSSGILFSVGTNVTYTGVTYTASSGFQPGTYFSSSDSFQQWDEPVSSGAYSNTITTGGATGYNTGILIGLSTTAVAYPVLRQHTRASGSVGADTSNTATFLSNVKSGDLIVAVVANQSGSSPGTTSDTQSNTYHLVEGGGSAQFGVWYASASSSGSLSVTNTVSNCIGIAEFQNVTGLTFDQKNTAANASATTINSGNITVPANEFIVAAGTLINSTSRLYFTSMSSGWDQLVFSCGGHYASAWLGWLAQVSASTYSNTFTWGGSASPVSASIFSFSAPGGNHQPSVSIISKSVKPELFRLH